MKHQLSALRHVALLTAALICASCATTSPPSNPPTPIPNPPPSDAFTLITVDCSNTTPAPAEVVLPCLDTSPANNCLAKLIPSHSVDAVACEVRSLSMLLHTSSERGGGSPQDRRRALSADSWVRTHQIGYR